MVGMTSQSTCANSQTIRLLIADDHELLRQALRNILKNEPDILIIGEATDGEETINMASELKPDIVVMDIQMPKVSGIEATKKIKSLIPETAVLVLTAFDDSEYIMQILDAGASGYLTKDIIGRRIPEAIRSVINGESILSEAVMKRLLKYALMYPVNNIALEHGEKLNTKEIEILRLIAVGDSNKVIAEKLGLSLNTIKKYTAAIFDKLKASSRTAAILKAQRAGLISLDKLD